MEHWNKDSESISDVASRLKAIIETAVDGIITIDEYGRIEAANPATCRIFGYDVEEMLGQNVTLLMPSPYHENHDGYMHNYRETGVRKIIGIGREVQGKKKNGTIGSP
jgi:two-component system, LuxR family, sensor kinase FixL